MAQCSGASKCQTAKKTDCECDCGGVNHGARGRLVWAAALATPVHLRSEEDVRHAMEAHRRQTEASYALEDCLRPKKQRLRSGTSFYCQDADRAAEFLRSVDVINWLVDHPEDIATLGELVDLFDDALTSLDAQYNFDARQLHHRTADHLWCDIVAALVAALEELTNLQDNLTTTLTDAAAETVTESVLQLVHASRGRPGEQRPRGRFRERMSRAQLDAGRDVTRQLLEPVISGIVGAALTAVGWTVSPLPPVLFKLRLLAVLLCPDPSRHKAVWDHCLVPLFEDSFTSAPLAKLLEERTALLSEMDWGGRRPARRGASTSKR